MLKTTITASYIDGSTRELPGYSIAPGLAVHRAVTMTGEETNDWNVTHAPSGFRVCGSFPTRKQAVAAATEFGPLVDWTLPYTKEVWGWHLNARGLIGKLLAIRSRILYAGPLSKSANTNPTNQGRLF
jgi:hypothetical protein